MKDWEEFEIEATAYLNKKFGSFAQFSHQGGSDSTIPDILVTTNSGPRFYIEAKLCPAQCGQFVLLPNLQTSQFDFSTRNKTTMNDSVQSIITHMNRSFDEFRNAGTEGKAIIMENGPQIFSDWIIRTYGEKDTKFFITNDGTIFPILNLSEYLYVTATYRIKRSGSSNVGKRKAKIFSNWLTDNTQHNYQITNTLIQDTKLFVTSNIDIDNQRCIYGKYEYMFSKRIAADAVTIDYELRQLSNTYNANVIFSVNYIGAKAGLTDAEFITQLR